MRSGSSRVQARSSPLTAADAVPPSSSSSSTSMAALLSAYQSKKKDIMEGDIATVRQLAAAGRSLPPRAQSPVKSPSSTFSNAGGGVDNSGSGDFDSVPSILVDSFALKVAPSFRARPASASPALPGPAKPERRVSIAPIECSAIYPHPLDAEAGPAHKRAAGDKSKVGSPVPTTAAGSSSSDGPAPDLNDAVTQVFLSSLSLNDPGAVVTTLPRPASASSLSQHRSKRQHMCEAELVAHGIAQQIAADAASTMHTLLGFFDVLAAPKGPRARTSSADECESVGASSGVSAASALGKVVIANVTNESLRSASAQLQHEQAESSAATAAASGNGAGAAAAVVGGGRRHFIAAKYDILLETLTKRTSDRFGIGQTEASKLSNEAQRQLMSVASRGFSIRCLKHPAATFPIAIIFDPLADIPEWDTATGAESHRFKCKVKCMLVGRVHRESVDDSVLGHPAISRAAMTTSCTLNAVAAFEMKARRDRRHKRMLEQQKFARLVQAKRDAEARIQAELESHHSYNFDSDLPLLADAAEEPSAAWDEDRDPLEVLTASAKLPDSLKMLLTDKSRQDVAPLRSHKELPSVTTEHVVSYDLCTVEPYELIVYEEVDFIHGRPKDLLSTVVAGRSSLATNAGTYSKIEYTLRWNVPIGSVAAVSHRDEWVRRRLLFPEETRQRRMPLNHVLAVCKRGAASIDLQEDRGGGPSFEYRHSFTFSKMKFT